MASSLGVLGLLVSALAVALAVALATLAHPGSALAARRAAVVPGSLSGTIAGIEADNFTIQTGGRPTGVIHALTDAANAVTRQDTPYVWGGGHGEAGVASVGDIGGPGANGKNVGYDCSGAVAAVLTGAGLWSPGSAVPNDAGVIAVLLARGLIAPGPGTAPNEVTLYDHPGVHIFMNINGRFFGTSDGGAGGDGKGGAGWLDDSATDARSRAFKQYHFLPSVLRDETTYGQEYTFQLNADPGIDSDFLIGDKVHVDYRAAGGSMTVAQLGWVGARNLTGTLTSLGPDGNGLVVQTASGKTYSLAATDVEDSLDSLVAGDSVKLVYLRNRGALTARVLTVTAAPSSLTATGTITAIAADQSSLTIETSAGKQLTLATSGTPAMLTGLGVGTQVQADYTEWPNGTLLATTLSPYETSAPANGTVTTPQTTTPPSTTPTPTVTTTPTVGSN